MGGLFGEILQTLRNNRLRTALTGLSVSWGVFMLIVLLGVARGVTNSFEYNMGQTSKAKIRIYSGQTSKPYHGNREGRRIYMSMADMGLLEDEHPDFIENVTSSMYLGSGNITTGGNSVSASPSGLYPIDVKNQGYKITDGRSINQRDMQQRAKVMVLPSNYAQQLFPPDGASALGSRINYNGLSFTVVGVYESEWDRTVIIPFSTAMMLTGNEDKLSVVTVYLKNLSTEDDARRAENEIRATMAQAKDYSPDDSSALWFSNSLANSLQGAKVMGMLNMAVWILGLLTLLTGIVGISNIMFVSVRERTHEIGIRRAIGAKPRSVLTQVIAESVAITLLFGYIGIVLGMVVTQIISLIVGETDFMRNPTINISIAIEVTIVLAFAGALAGLFPALRALKIKPVEALRDE